MTGNVRMNVRVRSMFMQPLLQRRSSTCYIFCLCVFSLILYCAVLYCHLWPVCPYRIFPHYFINRTIIGERSCLTNCDSSSLKYFFFLKHFSFWEELSEIFHNYRSSLCKVPVILVRLKLKFNLWTEFRKTIKYEI